MPALHAVKDHAGRGPVLDRTARIHELRFSVNPHTLREGTETGQLEQGSAPDQREYGWKNHDDRMSSRVNGVTYLQKTAKGG